MQAGHQLSQLARWRKGVGAHCKRRLWCKEAERRLTAWTQPCSRSRQLLQTDAAAAKYFSTERAAGAHQPMARTGISDVIMRRECTRAAGCQGPQHDSGCTTALDVLQTVQHSQHLPLPLAMRLRHTQLISLACTCPFISPLQHTAPRERQTDKAFRTGKCTTVR
jgi:hypothetical protein